MRMLRSSLKGLQCDHYPGPKKENAPHKKKYLFKENMIEHFGSMDCVRQSQSISLAQTCNLPPNMYTVVVPKLELAQDFRNTNPCERCL
jgi:hypothetical protein